MKFCCTVAIHLLYTISMSKQMPFAMKCLFQKPIVSNQSDCYQCINVQVKIDYSHFHDYTLFSGCHLEITIVLYKGGDEGVRY